MVLCSYVFQRTRTGTGTGTGAVEMWDGKLCECECRRGMLGCVCGMLKDSIDIDVNVKGRG